MTWLFQVLPYLSRLEEGSVSRWTTAYIFIWIHEFEFSMPSTKVTMAVACGIYGVRKSSLDSFKFSIQFLTSSLSFTAGVRSCGKFHSFEKTEYTAWLFQILSRLKWLEEGFDRRWFGLEGEFRKPPSNPLSRTRSLLCKKHKFINTSQYDGYIIALR